ncbi:DUF6934 family protein [Pinibacter soli]|uniref:Uncharacterized protein n=1 Tax=Pinibacter soli TaxID=3044211 RepID=A0ABT6RE01_9BACT|nr:hypothetical protein [Pinibacter soli]MDI3320810.1 hypothetical protein [Pinibacter soli]
MQLDKYEMKVSSSLRRFELVSTGPKGEIHKKIEFNLFPTTPNVYNLGFGDVTGHGDINNLIVTDNGDSKKVFSEPKSVLLC